MKLINSKVAQVQAVPLRLFLIVIGLIIFFTMYPVLSSIIDAIALTQTDEIIVFLINTVPYVVILGLFIWILKGEA